MQKPDPDALVAEAIEVFQPYYKRPLTEADGRTITRNLGDVLLMLAAWRDEDIAKAASGSPGEAEPAPPTGAASPAPEPSRRKKTRRFPAEPL